MCGRAAGVHAEHLAVLLQPLVDGAPEARQQHLALPQAVHVNWEGSQVLGKDQLQNTCLISACECEAFQRDAFWGKK